MPNLPPATYADFVRENNWIDGIVREPTPEEIEATEKFIEMDAPVVSDILDLARVYEPSARLRDRPDIPGHEVNGYIAPPSGPAIMHRLTDFIPMMWDHFRHDVHIRFELLQPLSCANGRVGRAIWLWMFHREHGNLPASFLRRFYFDQLEREGVLRGGGETELDKRG